MQFKNEDQILQNKVKIVVNVYSVLIKIQLLPKHTNECTKFEQ